MGALDGIRVIDLTHFEAGPFCTEMLAFLGADVIKIERPGGDSGRKRLPRPPGDNPEHDSFAFMMLNASKRSVCLDLHTEKAQEIVRRLCKDADVFIESFAPGVVERLGFDYESLNKINPRLIFAQIKGFNPDGPYGDYKSMNAMALAMGGVMATTGYPDGPPLLPGPHLADTGSGLHMALGVVAALYQREKTGRGQKVRVAMQEASMNFCRPAFAKTFSTGKAAGRQGNGAMQAGIGSEMYQTAPGGPNDYVMLGLQRTATNWDAVFDLIERPDAKNDPRFTDKKQQAEHAEEFHELISSWTKRVSKKEAMEKMASIGIPAGATLDTDELIADPDLIKTGAFVPVEHPQRGTMLMPGFPVRLADSTPTVGPAPLAGQHTKEVLSELLGFQAEELKELEKSGVIATNSV